MHKRKPVASVTELFFKHIARSLPQYVFWKNTDSVYLGCNNHYAQLLGLSSPEAIIGKTDRDLNWQPEGDTAALFQMGDRQTLSGRPVTNQQEILVLPNGKKIIALVSKLPIIENGQALGIVGYFSDITELKEKELELQAAKQKADAANQAKSAFITNISHDIRTPLSGLVGFAELMAADRKIPAHQQESLRYLVQSGHALLKLFNEVIEFSQLEFGVLPHSSSKFNLAELVSHVIELEMPSAAEKKLALQTEIDSAIPPYLVSDAVRLHRILLNLLSNAIKFTHAGFVRISAQLAQQKGQEIILKILVQDSGVGIPADKQELIFSRFTRLIPSYQGQYTGFGLGLAVVKQFIDDLHGEIYVDSQEQLGSTFTCVIPCRQALLEEDKNVVHFSPQENKKMKQERSH